MPYQAHNSEGVSLCQSSYTIILVQSMYINHLVYVYTRTERKMVRDTCDNNFHLYIDTKINDKH